jgi:hypothetical protein
LNDDFAVLSACNTAAGYKPGAEALSGLARAFFYAGARSLVVSHCNVDSEATVALMEGLFAALKAKSGSFPRGGLADVDVANDRQFFENRIDSAELLGSVRDCWRAEK